MGYEPVTYCANCNEAADVYQPGFWLCDGCAEAEITEEEIERFDEAIRKTAPLVRQAALKGKAMNRCENCKNWARKSPDDLTAPEGYCGLSNDPGFWPFGYWPATLQSDGCGDGFAEQPALTAA